MIDPTAPKPMLAPITLDDLAGLIEGEQYYVFPGTTTTVCCLTLRSGFQVIGQSACLDLARFNAEVGRHLARENAAGKLWELEGYHRKAAAHDYRSNDIWADG